MPRGFTLVELVVAIGILVVVLQLVLGAYSRFVNVERRGIQEQELQEDIRLMLQLFNREARTAYGTTYQINKIGDTVFFRNQSNVCVKYELIDHSLYRSEGPASTDLSELQRNCADPAIYVGGARRITDERTTIITGVGFDVWPALVDPANPFKLVQQGFVSMRLQVRTPGASESVPLQSVVTSRQFIPYNPS